MRLATKIMTGLILGAALAGATLANELVGNAPFTDSSFGHQSDVNSLPKTQAFVAPASSILESIRWWGFHSQDSGGASFDNFVVTLDGVVQTGSLTVTSISSFFDEYTLDVVDAALNATLLSIVNDSSDVEWFWQSTMATGNPNAADADAVAFSLIGRQGVLPPDGQTVPEPTSLALILLAMAVLVPVRARNSGPTT